MTTEVVIRDFESMQVLKSIGVQLGNRPGNTFMFCLTSRLSNLYSPPLILIVEPGLLHVLDVLTHRMKTFPYDKDIK